MFLQESPIKFFLESTINDSLINKKNGFSKFKKCSFKYHQKFSSLVETFSRLKTAKLGSYRLSNKNLNHLL